MSTVLHDKHARRRILLSTAGLAAAGGVIGLNIAILKNLQPIYKHTLTMTANWAVYGVFFFTVRETLLYDQKQRGEALDLQFSLTRDHDEMYSSLCSGMVTGGTLSFIARRTKGAAFSGALFFGLVSAAGQFLYTRMNRRRQAIILERLASKDKLASSLSSLDQNKGFVATGDSDYNYANVDPNTRPSLLHLLKGTTVPADWSDSPIARLRRRLQIDPISLLPEWFPMRRISFDEYHSMLVERKRLVFEELAQLRLAIADMEMREKVLLQRLRQQEEN
ncbi:hypothetical protein GGI11_000100 [Coemansia sp. RSA 2049]|nr:hypothetical protein GGI11_000100 [Coemansia sp. RSA 2049]